MAAAGAHPPPSAQEEGSEESFSLESSGPPAFAALIRLTPDLVDEIRRAEEAGGGARIMFNSDINPWENVSSLSLT
jgi:WD and tetratricopeptide repeat-containing protein 1